MNSSTRIALIAAIVLVLVSGAAIALVGRNRAPAAISAPAGDNPYGNSPRDR